MTIHRLDLLQPTTLEEASALYLEHEGDASFIAGGTALLIYLRERFYQPGYLIDLKTIPGLDYLRHEPGVGLRIGALVTHWTMERSPLVRQHAPVLAETYREVGNVRVRHAATVGGNLAHGDYRLDPPAPLIALRARARLVRQGGARELPLEQFFLDIYTTALEPGEIVAEVFVPDPPAGTGAVYLKYQSLSAMDWPCLGVAAALTPGPDGTVDDLRVVLTSVASRPVLLQGVNELVRGQRLTDQLIGEVQALVDDQIDPTDDIRGSAWYKREMARLFVGRAIRAAQARARPIARG